MVIDKQVFLDDSGLLWLKSVGKTYNANSIIFKTITDINNKALLISKKAADYVISIAVPEGNGLKWAFQSAYTHYNPIFENGAAGVGYFLLNLYRVTQNTTYLQYAEKAATWIIAEAQERDGGFTWSQYDDDRPREWSSGWYLTPEKSVSGVARFLLELYKTTGKTNYLYYAEGAANWIINVGLVKTDHGSYVKYNPYHQAAFGVYSYPQRDVGVLFLDLYEATGKTLYLDKAKEIGNWILSTSECNDNICKWYDDRGYGNLYVIEGIAPLVDFLYKLHKKTGNPSYLNTAEKMVNWVETKGVWVSSDKVKFLDLEGKYRTIIWGFWDRLLSVMTPADVFLWSYEITGNYKRLGVAKAYFNWLISISVSEGNGLKIPEVEGMANYHAWVNARIYNYIMKLYSLNSITIYLDYAEKLLNWIIYSAMDKNGYVWPYDGREFSTFSLGSSGIGYYVIAQGLSYDLSTEPITLPYTWNGGITCHYLDLNISREGYQQSITVKPGENVEAEIKFQRWSGAGNPSEINQVFLLYSWSTSWNPPSTYTPLWNGISGTYPGITKVVRFSFTAPKETGTYYIWIRIDAMYSMEDALSNIWNKYHGPPPYSDDLGGIIGKVVVAGKEETTTSTTSSPSPTITTPTSPTTTPTTFPTSPFTKPSEQRMDIMNIIGLILVMIAVLVFISAAVFYFRGRKPDTKRIHYPEEKPPPVLASEKAYPAATKTLEETISKPSILKMEAPKLSIDEWGKILVNVKGKGKVSINLEGNVEWKDPGINEISGESTIEIPVKPKVSGDVPVKVIIDTPYGKESSMIFLKVEKKEVIPPQFVTPITVKEKVGLDEIIPLRNIPLKNLVSGYGCSSSKLFKVNLSTPTVPKEFEGAWNCCLLGCGGWGCAYLATRGNEKIVIKVPRGFESVIEGSIEAPTSHEALLKKIRSETEIMSTLNHPNIIKFLGSSSRIPLVIYEFADYGSLYWQLIKGWRPSLRDAVLIGIQLGDALRYIHSRGLIHGDIKPSNVFIKNGVAKLGDFSSTVKLLSSVSISKLPYTVGFRAPEQVFLELKRKARELGVENRIDIYQLGNLLLYILTGESIDGEDAEDEKLVMEKLSMVPNEELRAILEEALKLEPDKRPSAEEFTKKLYDIWRKIAQ
jgi:hypothetical protein